MEPSQLSEIVIKLDALKDHIDNFSNPYWPAVIAGGFAVFAAMFSGQAMEFTKHQRQRRAIRTALIAEVRAIKKIAVSRKYLNMLRNLEKNPEPIRISIPSNYNLIYVTNASHLGLLDPDTAQKVVTFHQYIEGVLQDVAPGGVLTQDFVAGEAFREARAILRDAIEIADDL